MPQKHNGIDVSVKINESMMRELVTHGVPVRNERTHSPGAKPCLCWHSKNGERLSLKCLSGDLSRLDQSLVAVEVRQTRRLRRRDSHNFLHFSFSPDALPSIEVNLVPIAVQAIFERHYQVMHSFLDSEQQRLAIVLSHADWAENSKQVVELRLSRGRNPIWVEAIRAA